ncbi:MAG: amino-acid N-acetyltransferase [Cumulibacter sp.]
MNSAHPPEVTIRHARTEDVRRIREIVAPYVENRVLVAKEHVAYFEGLQEFRIAEIEGHIVGVGALHVFWEDLAEVRTLAVDSSVRGAGVGHLLLERLVEDARQIGVQRVFCLTFEVDFFSRHGFREIDGTPVDKDVFVELLQSQDDGVAEFLDLARVKPNTLGNSRMLLDL